MVNLTGLCLVLLSLSIGCGRCNDRKANRHNHTKETKKLLQPIPIAHLSGIIEIEPSIASDAKLFKIKVECDICLPTIYHNVASKFKVPIFERKKPENSLKHKLAKTLSWQRKIEYEYEEMGKLKIVILIPNETGLVIEREWQIDCTDDQLMLNEMSFIFKIGAYQNPSLLFSIVGKQNELETTEDTTIVVRGLTEKMGDEAQKEHGIVLLAKRKMKELQPTMTIMRKELVEEEREQSRSEETIPPPPTAIQHFKIDFTQDEWDLISLYLLHHSSKTKIAVEIWNTKIEKYHMGDAENSSKPSENCAICQEEYKNGEEILTTTSCNHMFHYKCSASWFSLPSNGCPLCRSPNPNIVYQFFIQDPVFSNDQYKFEYLLAVNKLMWIDYLVKFFDPNNLTKNFWEKETSMWTTVFSTFLKKDRNLLNIHELEIVRTWELKMSRLQTIAVVPQQHDPNNEAIVPNADAVVEAEDATQSNGDGIQTNL